jgi:predicted alpha/beta-fold hydrolase
LQLIENAEFHHVSPGDGLFSQNTVFWCGAESSLGQFRAAEAGLRRACEWLVSAGSRVVASANDVFPHREIMPTFTPHQDSALMAVADWLKAKPGKKGTPPIFRLFGYAGTGKTTLARHLAEGVDGEVKFAAFTG